jgi:type VI secretion system secreted protein Hcp
MASAAYLLVKGQKQGDIHGSVTAKGHENTILVHSFDFEIVSPRDAASGLPTGKRQHQPLTILKEIDKSTPLLLNAFVNNENLVSVQLQFRGTSADGREIEIYTIQLTNASIVSISQSLPDTSVPQNAQMPLRENISLSYQKIQWTWIDGGITASDDWLTS